MFNRLFDSILDFDLVGQQARTIWMGIGAILAKNTKRTKKNTKV